MRIKPGILDIYLKKFTKEMILNYLETVRMQKIQPLSTIENKLNVVMDDPIDKNKIK